MKITEKTGIQENFLRLKAEDIFPNRKMTPEDVVFIEHCLDKIHVDLETDTHEEFIMSTNQVLYLVRGIMREYDTFLSDGKKFED